MLRQLLIAKCIAVFGFCASGQIRPPAETLGHDAFKAMEEFSRCAVRFEIASAVASDAEQPATAEEYAGAARGSKSVATFYALALASESSETESADFSSELQGRMDQIDSFIELEWINQAAFGERGEMDEAGFKYCFDIQGLQIQIIDLMRREGLL